MVYCGGGGGGGCGFVWLFFSGYPDYTVTFMRGRTLSVLLLI